MVKVNIGMSSRGNDLNSDLVKWIILQRNNTDMYTRVYISKCNTSAVKAQSGLFKDMYANPNFDCALFLDTDIVPPVDVIKKLISTGKDVVTAPIWCFDDYNRDIHLNVHYTFNNSMQDRVYKAKESGIEQIESSSFSCLLVRKSVFDKFYSVSEDPILWSPMIDKRWQGMENDMIFFQKLKKFGIPAYVCWDAKGGQHHRHVTLCDEVLDKYIARRGK